MSTSRTTDLGDSTLIEIGEPTVGNPTVWFTRQIVPKAGTSAANAQTLLDKAAQALTTNATYLGRGNPTAAQTTAQVQALTRQINALIRLLVVMDTSTIADA